jgi:hypothetical protein
MRISYFLILVLILSTKSFAGHIGCVNFYERILCETEQTFQYKSEVVSWEMTKEDFKNKIQTIVEKLVPNQPLKLATVFLWVNDFNSQSSMRLQVWTQEKNFILDVPTDFMNANLEENISVRGGGALPYPADFGFTLGELVVLCQDQCTQEHKDWLTSSGQLTVQDMLPNMLMLVVPKFSEAKTLENLKTRADFNRLFTSIELSPVLEGNGFREQAFSIYF